MADNADAFPTPNTDEASTDPQPTASALSNSAHLRQKRARSQLSCTPCRQGKLKCDRARDPACDQCIKRGREAACIYVPPPVRSKPSQNVKGRIRQLESMVVDLMNAQNKEKAERESKEAIEATDKRRKSGTMAERGSNSTEAHKPARNLNDQPTPPSDNDGSPSWTHDGAATHRSTGTDSPDRGNDPVSREFGQMKISKNEISYVGESHWHAILDGISNLKRDLADEGLDDKDENEGGGWGDEDEEGARKEPPEQTLNSWESVNIGGAQPHATTGLGFMLGNSQHVTKEQLIASVPEKRVADRLLSLWFNSPDPFKPIIHAPTFQDEYRRFWRNPQSTPTMWLGLLYAILSLAESFGLRDGDASSQTVQDCLARVNRYHTLAASAAVLADFTKPKQYTMECLILYAAGLRSNNAFVNVWLMIGLVLRLGLRMGYHRDPSHYPNISPFTGEMRRRTWAIISMIDVLISFQLGLPSIVRTINSDTEPPRNLLDRDFGVNTKALPPNRGPEELTPASYIRSKVRITRVFAQAAELSHLTIDPSTEEVMRLDRELEQARAAVPPLLQMPDITELVTDPAEQLMCRFNLDLLYLKAKTVLHRRYMLTPLKFLSVEEQARGIGVSRKNCIECALRVLQHHQSIYHMSQPGGQLESVKWYMGSISTHDFLLAAMVLCLELSKHISDDAEGLAARQMCPRRLAMMQSLESSQRIWAETSLRNREARGQVVIAGTGASLPTHNGEVGGEVSLDGKGWKGSGLHMLDDTEKASRAMAVMIEKVKAHYPEQKFQNVGNFKGPVDSPDGIPNGALGQGRELENWSDDLSDRAMNLEGIQPSMQMGDFEASRALWNLDDNGQFNAVAYLNGTQSGFSYPRPDTISPGAGTVDSSRTIGSSNSGGVALPLAQNVNDFPIDQSKQDFAAIGDMLDVGMNFDWDNFDTTTLETNGFTYNQEDNLGSQNFDQDPSKDDYVLFGAFPQRVPQQSMQQQTGVHQGVPLRAGNAMVGMGTGPGSGDLAQWNINVMPEDINTDSMMAYSTDESPWQPRVNGQWQSA